MSSKKDSSKNLKNKSDPDYDPSGRNPKYKRWTPDENHLFVEFIKSNMSELKEED